MARESSRAADYGDDGRWDFYGECAVCETRTLREDLEGGMCTKCGGDPLRCLRCKEETFRRDMPAGVCGGCDAVPEMSTAQEVGL